MKAVPITYGRKIISHEEAKEVYFDPETVIDWSLRACHYSHKGKLYSYVGTRGGYRYFEELEPLEDDFNA